jgi:hypothetical protein
MLDVVAAVALSAALKVDSDLATPKPALGASETLSWPVNKPHKSQHREIVLKAAKVPKKWRPFAACVLKRESGGTLDKIQSGVGARNPNSSASGRWQFLNTYWQHGGSFMVRDRLIDYGMPKKEARLVRQYLGDTRINRWHGYYQDILFNEVISRGGKHHWNGPGC